MRSSEFHCLLSMIHSGLYINDLVAVLPTKSSCCGMLIETPRKSLFKRFIVKHEWNDGRALSHSERHHMAWKRFWAYVLFVTQTFHSQLSMENMFDRFISATSYEMRKLFPRKCFPIDSSECSNSPCETAGLEQLLVSGILELPGVSDESSQCLLFILLAVVVVLLPQFEVDDALLLSVNNQDIRSQWNH